MDGIIVINKPAGYTSHDCIAILRGVSGQKKLGHTGTLDPNATGVLPVCFGKATKLIEYMDDATKSYIAGFRLGLVSDTQDIWGTMLDNPFNGADAIAKGVDSDAVKSILRSFEGEIEQIPPAYSAVQIEGRRAYSIARSGEKPKLKARKIKVYSIMLLDYNPNSFEGCFEICCGRGTYVRTICNDLGEKLGCGAVLSSLTRTGACGFDIDEAIDLEEARKMSSDELFSKLYPLERAIGNLQKMMLTQDQKSFYLNGMTLKTDPSGYEQQKPIAVFCGDELLGISQLIKDSLKPIKVFS